ncbi:ChbG/HpnK family deacetylase [Herbaspirillum sp. RTI4]|uniref:ChbG/HpnK family deacetylase n=1 Tax=Herbaspirillum sp. RTI4 TaxID=3048640 RepID=UPI002AB5D182|nr:ChbG/HpnK family deacetylase [Herbaspirillum sp. RTI4]MDY7577793.1 ChbG/HpnK family deacetylase [Herbaspirillum sp. RTI4]MEA9980779.1 ChbG/HpnK family deacetylase [Herbaspirillum sp. RTI4]
MMAPIPIALCADDYAQNAGVDAAVCDLLHQQRLSATSCFSTAPRWLSHAAPALRELPRTGRADIGLHFNLTEGFGQPSPFGLSPLILRSFMHALDRDWLTRTLHAQLDAFEMGWGGAPDFIDGHQHVHQLPLVRQVLLQVVQQRYAGQPLWIRNTLPADLRWGGKSRILQWLGGAALARDLQRAGLHSNRGFAGVYGFDRSDYDACFAGWLKAAAPGMLIMCHPATEIHGGDPIAAQRLVEYRFLRSPEFTAMLASAGVHLAPLSSLRG